MKVLAIQGSPRKSGNTHALLDLALESATKAGAAVEVVEVHELGSIFGCVECYACQKDRRQPSCAIDDRINEVLDRMLAFDVIVWATPVFCWSPSWLAKIVMDRLYAMFKFDDAGVTSLLAGRKMAAVITAAGGPSDGAHMVEEAYRQLAAFSQCTWLGALVAANATEPEAIRSNADLTEAAATFGNRLAG